MTLKSALKYSQIKLTSEEGFGLSRRLHPLENSPFKIVFMLVFPIHCPHVTAVFSR